MQHTSLHQIFHILCSLAINIPSLSLLSPPFLLTAWCSSSGMIAKTFFYSLFLYHTPYECIRIDTIGDTYAITFSRDGHFVHLTLLSPSHFILPHRISYWSIYTNIPTSELHIIRLTPQTYPTVCCADDGKVFVIALYHILLIHIQLPSSLLLFVHAILASLLIAYIPLASLYITSSLPFVSHVDSFGVLLMVVMAID